MSTGEQLEVLDGFRRNAFNVLVATNVIEEGLDVRSCNVVVKADPLTNFRSFIQSQVSCSLPSASFFCLRPNTLLHAGTGGLNCCLNSMSAVAARGLTV